VRRGFGLRENICRSRGCANNALEESDHVPGAKSGDRKRGRPTTLGLESWTTRISQEERKHDLNSKK